MAASFDQESDARVVELSIEDGQAFTLIFDRHYRVVHRFLVSHWGGDVGADLAAQTFLVAFDQRDRFDRTRLSARPWLFGIAMNLSRMEARRRRRETEAIVKAAERDEVEDFVDSMIRRLDAQRQATNLQLSDALRQLRPEEATVLTMTVLGEMTHAQVAEALNLPLGTVKSRLHRAVAALRDRRRPDAGKAAGSKGLDDED